MHGLAPNQAAAFFHLSAALVCLLDRDGVFVWTNAAFTERLGWLPGELLGRPFAEFIHADDLAGSLAAFQNIIAHNDGNTYEQRVRCKDGSYRWIAGSAAVDDATGSIYGIAADVTDQKFAIAALNESETNYRSLFDDHPSPMWVFDAATHRVVAVNEAAIVLYGYSRAEFTALTIEQLRPSEDMLQLALAGTLSENPPAREELRHVKRDGSLIDVSVRRTPSSWDGRPSYFVSVADQTAFRRAQAQVVSGQRKLSAVIEASSENEVRLQTLLSAVPALIWHLDRELRFVFVDGSPAGAVGVTFEQLRGVRMKDCVRKDAYYETIIDAQSRALRGESVSYDFVRDGVSFQAHVEPLRGRSPAGDAIVGVIGVALDVSDRRKSDDALSESRLQLAKAQELAHLGSWDIDHIARTTTCSDELLRILGIYGRAITPSPKHYLSHVHPDDRALVDRTYARAIAAQEPLTLEHRIVRDDGTVRWLLVRGEYRFAPDGSPTGLAGAVLDITDRKLAEQRLQFLAHYDPLTGLPNRTRIYDELGKSLLQSVHDGSAIFVMFIDLDGFKNVNDTLGHAFGDELLKAVAQRLQTVAEDVDCIGRLGGDEFVVVARRAPDPVLGRDLVAQIATCFATPFVVHGREFYISSSIGVSVAPIDGLDADALIQNADTAMYRAKEGGRNSVCFFTPEMRSEIVLRRSIENDLRFAVERGELRLHYQPIVDAATGRIVGSEALLRWRHPSAGLVGPSRFIEVAEASGLIVPIGAWVLAEAADQNRRWQALSRTPLRMSVNVAARQISHPKFLDHVRAALASGLPAHLLEIEITETGAMTDIRKAVEVLTVLRSLGVRTALDDFGTGYSSLSYLRRLPVDTVKIDRSFVREIETERKDAVIAEAIVTIAHALNLDVVSEGVETPEQFRSLGKLGVDLMQGYLFGRPVPPAEFEAMLRAGRVWRVDGTSDVA
ncbi:MAG: sensor domain-containing protein [Vulcanimicrobiaceae bacterium]